MLHYQLIGAHQTDRGQRRPENQDYAVLDTDHPERGCLALVADGMGGHRHGEQASRLSAEIIRNHFFAAQGDPGDDLEAAIQEANRRIRALEAGMGTTIVALNVRDGAAFFAHVGDSRLYLSRGGRLFQLTEDHSRVMAMVRDGVLTREEARQHPARNELTCAIGFQDPLDVARPRHGFPLAPGDRFLLCTDGLFDLIDEDRLRRTLDALPPAEAARELVDEANRHGGHDNITALILHVNQEAEPASC